MLSDNNAVKLDGGDDRGQVKASFVQLQGSDKGLNYTVHRFPLGRVGLVSGFWFIVSLLLSSDIVNVATFFIKVRDVRVALPPVGP